MSTVVIGYVPTAEGEAALATGIAEARLRDAEVLVVHRERDGEPDESGRAATRAALEEAAIPHEVRTMPEGAEFSEALVGAAEDVGAELIVIGLRRRTSTGKLILGANAQHVLLDAPCPVLTVKP